MDNVCHTLVGAALAESGLKRRTALGAATLMIGANFPDVDVLAVPLGHGVDFRRGWTHGVLALVVLPFVLTALMLAWDRIVAAPRAHRAGGERGRASPRELLLLSTLSILTHPTLDWMNEYGMRWLMPFSGRWFYGDTLFIIDPWLWTMLGAGVALARRFGVRAARVALALSAAYIVAMLSLAATSRRVVRRELAQRQELEPVTQLMVSASFAHPLRRRVLLEEGGRYHYGTLWLGLRPRFGLTGVIETQATAPEALAASRTSEGRRFLTWSRFPFYVVERRTEGTLVRIADARYAVGRRGGDWASVEVRLPPLDPVEAPTSDSVPTSVRASP